MSFQRPAPGQLRLRARHEVQSSFAQAPVSSRRQSVDYLIISHPLFIDHLTRLEALQQSRGYSTAVVDVESLYTAYSDHEVSAAAIRDYLKEIQPRFALLVGADSRDYHDYTGQASQSFVPTHCVRTDSLIRYAPSDSVHADSDGDAMPDLAIGRLPVRTVAELLTLLAKIERSQAPQHAVLSAGASDFGDTFVQVSADYELSLPANWTSSIAYVDHLGLNQARQTLRDELLLGAGLVSYHGHSSFAMWGSRALGYLLTAEEADTLGNSEPLLVTQWGCWNTYFVDPQQETMASSFLFHPTGGAAAVLGATALTDLGLLARLGQLFYRQLERQPTLGEAVAEAQRTMARTDPAHKTALQGFVLLGDPASPVQ